MLSSLLIACNSHKDAGFQLAIGVSKINTSSIPKLEIFIKFCPFFVVQIFVKLKRTDIFRHGE